MRMMLKVVIPAGAGNRAVRDGTLPRTIKETMDRLDPEASYFFAEDGKRTALFFFDLQDASQVPIIVEPLFMGMDAAVTIVPAMNAADFEKGLTVAAKNF